MISILLASYNGEKYIAEQIDSLLQQSVQNFKIFICDDKSTDSTYGIIEKYKNLHPKKVFISQNEKNLGGAKLNFIKMMAEFKDDYVMLCDQDDVWLPDKIEKSLQKIKEMENRFGKEKPLLIHTNLCVADENLEIISSSYWERVNAKVEEKKFNKVLVQNFAAGCTMMYNRALGELIGTEPDYLIMHDWWLVLLASAFGEIDMISKPTILYRQHLDNVHGSNKRSTVSHFSHKVFNSGEIKETLAETYKQAASFLSIYKDDLSGINLEIATAYASIPRGGKLMRLRILFKYKTWKNGLIRKIAQMLFI